MNNRRVIPFWERVKKQIRAHKISQEKLASRLGINYYTFRSWIYYNRIPDIVTGLYMAAALGVTVEYLATGHDGKIMEIREKQTLERKNAAGKIKKLINQIEVNVRHI